MLQKSTQQCPNKFFYLMGLAIILSVGSPIFAGEFGIVDAIRTLLYAALTANVYVGKKGSAKILGYLMYAGAALGAIFLILHARSITEVVLQLLFIWLWWYIGNYILKSQEMIQFFSSPEVNESKN